MRGAVALLAAIVTLCGATLDEQVPRYAHIFVIVEENKNYAQITAGQAPVLAALAREYGYATQFYAETHPSEPNYVALVGGSTYGIADDDAFFCLPHERDPSCRGSNRTGYVDHTVDAPNLATQLEAAHRSWKEYLESIPSPGSLVVDTQLYASRHSGFLNYLSVQHDPRRTQHLVGFDRFYSDLRNGNVPSFAMVIPDVCNEMHGAHPRPDLPAGCAYAPIGPLIRRGDATIATIVRAIMQSRVWRARENAAIVVTFDEDDSGSTRGCCGSDPSDPVNRGGGHIPTIVVTNHGPRHVADPTPYDHYSLLRTIEDAFGIHQYLRHAASPGVVPMVPLFRTTARLPKQERGRGIR